MEDRRAATKGQARSKKQAPKMREELVTVGQNVSIATVAPENAEQVGQRIGLAEIKGAQLQGLLDLWTAKKGSRRFPAREDIIPRDMKSFLRNITLIRITNDGTDFEYRVMGDAVVQAWGQSFVGMDSVKMNAIRKGMGEVIRRICASVAARGEPLVVRGELSRSELEHVGQESLFLPLGPDDATVDYILGASDFTAPRPFRVKERN